MSVSGKLDHYKSTRDSFSPTRPRGRWNGGGALQTWLQSCLENEYLKSLTYLPQWEKSVFSSSQLEQTQLKSWRDSAPVVPVSGQFHLTLWLKFVFLVKPPTTLSVKVTGSLAAQTLVSIPKQLTELNSSNQYLVSSRRKRRRRRIVKAWTDWWTNNRWLLVWFSQVA